MFVRCAELAEGRNRLMLDLAGEADWRAEVDRVQRLGVVGRGARLFESADVSLRLLESRQFVSGAVLLRYASNPRHPGSTARSPRRRVVAPLP